MNLIMRILTAILLLPIVIAATHFGNPWFVSLLMLVAFILSEEIVSLGFGKGHAFRPVFWPATLVAFVLLFIYPDVVSTLFGAWLFLFYFGAIFTFKPQLNFDSIGRFSLVILITLYTLLSLACAVSLRNGVNGDPVIGRSFIYLALLCTFSNDTFAYFFGKYFGKNKLLEKVSEKKTWEGFVAGAVASVLMPFIFVWFFDLFGLDVFAGLDSRDRLCVSIGIAFLGPLGDLIESRIKRAFNVKDSGSILPGHGGFFDRIDALLVTLPFTFAYAFFLRQL